MRRFPLHAPLALAALALACDPDLRTERGQVRLNADLHSYQALWSSHDIVAGSTVCPTFESHLSSDAEPPEYADADDDEIRACYDPQLRGVAGLDDEGCIMLPIPGTVTWELVRRPCALTGPFGDDEVRFDVLPLSEVRGAFEYAVPLPQSFHDAELEVLDELPDDYVAAVGEPVRVIEDRLEQVRTAVVRRDAPHMVAVTDPAVTAVALAGAPTFDPPDEPSMNVGVSARAGDVLAVEIELPAGTLPVGEVHVVSRDDVASMSLHPRVIRIADTDLFLELGAVAITRDREGRVLREPPVTWQVVEGPFALRISDRDEDGIPDPGPSAAIADACEGATRGEHRSVTLEGRLDDFQQTVRVEWDCIDPNLDVDDGCACRARGERPGAASMLSIVVLALARRRRRRSFARSTRST